jgi:hypothetical protein
LATYFGMTLYLDSLLVAGLEKDEIDNIDHRTPLSYTAEIGQLETLMLLIRYGANPNSHSIYGKTPLHFAATKDHHHVVVNCCWLRSIPSHQSWLMIRRNILTVPDPDGPYPEGVQKETRL